MPHTGTGTTVMVLLQMMLHPPAVVTVTE